MQRSGSYKRGDLILEQSLDRLFYALKEKEGKQISLDTFINILNSIHDEREYGFEVLEELRVDLSKDEETFLSCNFTSDLILCGGVLIDWVSLGKIREGTYYGEGAYYLLSLLGIENSLSQISYMQKYDLLGVRDLSHRGIITRNEVLAPYGNVFLNCFNHPSLFFFLQEWEKNQDDKLSIRRGAKKAIGDYQAAVEKLTFVPVFILQAILAEVALAGNLILDALFRKEAKRIKEARVHLEKIKNFFLCKGEPLKDLEAITRLEKSSPGFSQILFYLKGKKVEYGEGGNLISFVSSDKPVHIVLPRNLSMFSNQRHSFDERQKIQREGYMRFISSSLPNSLEGVHEIIKESPWLTALRDWIVFSDNFYWQRFDYTAIKEGFVNYVAGMYRIEKKEATKVYEFLKEKIEPEDLALFYAAADIILTTCVTKGEIDWQTLRIIVTSALIVKIAKHLKKERS